MKGKSSPMLDREHGGCLFQLLPLPRALSQTAPSYHLCLTSAEFFSSKIKSRQRLPLNLQDSEVSVSRGRSLRIQTRMCSRPCRMLLRHNALRSSAGTARKLLPFFYPRILPDGPPIPGPLTRCEFSTTQHRNPINSHPELKKMLATFRGTRPVVRCQLSRIGENRA